MPAFTSISYITGRYGHLRFRFDFEKHLVSCLFLFFQTFSSSRLTAHLRYTAQALLHKQLHSFHTKPVSIVKNKIFRLPDSKKPFTWFKTIFRKTLNSRYITTISPRINIQFISKFCTLFASLLASVFPFIYRAKRGPPSVSREGRIRILLCSAWHTLCIAHVLPAQSWCL